jgi:hypothetical protein
LALPFSSALYAESVFRDMPCDNQPSACRAFRLYGGGGGTPPRKSPVLSANNSTRGHARSRSVGASHGRARPVLGYDGTPPQRGWEEVAASQAAVFRMIVRRRRRGLGARTTLGRLGVAPSRCTATYDRNSRDSGDERATSPAIVSQPPGPLGGHTLIGRRVAPTGACCPVDAALAICDVRRLCARGHAARASGNMRPQVRGCRRVVLMEVAALQSSCVSVPIHRP